MNNELASELLELRQRDETVRTRLMESGALFEGYSEEMETVHLENGAALSEILEEHGWPGLDLVGEEAEEAAWLVAQHAISDPELQRRCLESLADAVASRQAPAWQLGYLTDRIRINAQKPQIFGTQFDWDEQGELSPCPIEAPAEVDQRRSEIGLVPLAEAVEMARQRARDEGHEAPVERQRSERLMQKWARRVGWIE